MREKESYEKCLETMFALGRFGIKLGLETIGGILDELDNPQDGFRCIHVAGTNGKGSIASTLATILQTAGFRTGLYTSPHLVKFNERIAVDLVPATDGEVVSAYHAVMEAAKDVRGPTFFEITTAMAFYEFHRKGVEWAVIETGMGGRLDATNIVRPSLCVISNLSIEHSEYLGDTIELIAREKGGIIKEKVPVVTGVSQKSAADVLNGIAESKNAPIHLKGRDFTVHANSDGSFDYRGVSQNWESMRTGLLGDHQVDNAALVLAACEALRPAVEEAGKGTLSTSHIREGLENTRWQGRLELVSESPYVLIDGAHNLVAAEKLAEFLSGHLSHREITLVVGILDDKPYEEMLGALMPICGRVVLTRPEINRSMPPERYLPLVEAAGIDHVVIPRVADAVKYAVENASDGDAVCIAGSLYVVGEAKEALAELL